MDTARQVVWSIARQWDALSYQPLPSGTVYDASNPKALPRRFIRLSTKGIVIVILSVTMIPLLLTIAAYKACIVGPEFVQA